MTIKSVSISRIFFFSLVALLNILFRSVHSWPLMDGGGIGNEIQDSDPLRLLRELEQRQAALKEEQAYNEHLESVLYAMALNNAKSAANDGTDDSSFDSRLLYRASRSHGKPTFIRFGKRAAPAFIRFGKRSTDAEAATIYGAEKRQAEALNGAKLTKSKI